MNVFNLKKESVFEFGLSVVIPTLGGIVLYKTIECLNNGNVIPNEIIIVIPEFYQSNIDLKLLPANAKVLFTKFSGQVAQRIFGFQNVRFQFTLQLDDDILLEKDCLTRLYQFIIDKNIIAVSPKLLELNTNNYFHYLKEPLQNEYVFKLLYRIINGIYGYESGKISLSGLGMGVSMKNINPSVVQWLPGGCVLHNSDNLSFLNYFNFKGKAYAEDLYHSYYLRKNGIQLYHLPNAIAYVDNSSSRSSSFFSFIKIVYFSSRSLIALNKLSNTNSYRLLLFQTIYFFIYLPSKKINAYFNNKEF